jgi:hypothetical protein
VKESEDKITIGLQNKGKNAIAPYFIWDAANGVRKRVNGGFISKQQG